MYKELTNPEDGILSMIPQGGIVQDSSVRVSIWINWKENSRVVRVLEPDQWSGQVEAMINERSVNTYETCLTSKSDEDVSQLPCGSWRAENCTKDLGGVQIIKQLYEESLKPFKSTLCEH